MDKRIKHREKRQTHPLPLYPWRQKLLIKKTEKRQTHTESRSSVSWNLFTKGSASVCIAGAPKSPLKTHPETFKSQIIYIYYLRLYIYEKRILSTDDEEDGRNGPVLNDGVVRFVAVRSHDRRSCISGIGGWSNFLSSSRKM